MAGTFSQQLATQTAQQQQGRITRTQRLVQQQREAEAKAKYEQLSAEAERLRTQEFIDKPVEQTTQELVPTKYIDRYGNIMPKWINMSDWNKRRELANTKQQFTTISKVQQVQDPFTFQEYQLEYSKLSPELQQFFQPPERIIEQREQQKIESLSLLQNKIDSVRAKLQSKIEQIRRKQEEWDQESSDYKNRNASSFRKRMKELELDKAKYQEQLTALEGGVSEVQQGYDVASVMQYAESKGEYKYALGQSKIQSREQFKTALEKGELDEQLAQLNLLKENATYGKYTALVEEYNKNVKQMEQLGKWGEQIGYEKLPEWAKTKLNPMAQSWQSQNPTEKLVYDKKGNILGVQSQTFGKYLPIEEYNKQVEEQNKKYKEQEAKYKSFTYQEGKDFPTAEQIKEQQGKPKGFFSTLGEVTGITKGFNWLGERVHWDIKKAEYNPIAPLLPAIDIFSFGKRENLTETEKVMEKGATYLEEKAKKTEETAIGKENITQLDSELQAKYQQEYQKAFESQYEKKLFFGETTFDIASKQFEQSYTAKDIESRYAKEYQSKYLEMQQKLSPLKKYSTAGKIGIYEFGAKALRTLESPVKTGVILGALYTGGALLKALPKVVTPIVDRTLLFGSFSYGTYQTFSPKTSLSEKGAGILTMGITGGIAGYRGIKYLKSPVIKTKPVKYPKTSMKTYALGREAGSFYIKQGKQLIQIEKTIYPRQKLSRTVTTGRRTIVTTKWRDLMNKYLGTNLKNIYEGVPTQQKAVYGQDVFRGTKYKITESGYQRAYKLLIKNKYTPLQAKQTLRYYSPKVVTQTLESGKIYSITGGKTNKAVGEFIYKTEQPILNIDESLGIKTRGAKAVRDTYTFTRIEGLKQLRGKELDYGLITERGVKDTAFITKQGASYNLLKQARKTQTQYLQQSIVGSGDIQKGIRLTPTLTKGIKLKIPYEFQDIYALSKKMQISPLKRRVELGRARTDIIKSSQLEENIPIYDAGEFEGFKLSKGEKIGFGKVSVKRAVEKKIIESQVEKSQILEKPELKTQISKEITKQTQFQQLKMVTPPEVRGDRILREIAIVERKNALMSGTGLLSVGASKLKLKTNLKNMLKLKLTPATKVNLMQRLKLEQIPALKNIPRLSQVTQLKTISPLKPQLRNLLRIPPMETPTLPKRVFTAFGGSKGEMKNKERRKQRLIPEISGLIPDFTAKVIGLEGKEFGSSKEALREINKIRTGFEVSTGGRIKGFTPRNMGEQDLLKGILE